MASAAAHDNTIPDQVRTALQSGPKSIGELMDATGLEDRSEVKKVLRRLIRDGDVATTAEWNYKLATRLKR